MRLLSTQLLLACASSCACMLAFQTFHTFLWFPDICEAGWSFLKGSCYYTSDRCETWMNASSICRSMAANLVSIGSQQENLFIQHRHNGDSTWIGLNDVATEGLFTWEDGHLDKFRFWAKQQPNDLHGEDCVHTLGIHHGYVWNDVDCSVCHKYTCEKGIIELTRTNKEYFEKKCNHCQEIETSSTVFCDEGLY